MTTTHVLSLVPPPEGGVPLAERGDDELMQLAAAGVPDAFSSLVRRYQAGVRTYCGRVCGATGDDVAQEVFLAVFRARHDYVANGHFRQYLFTIALRRCRNALRNQRTRLKLSESEQQEPSARTSLDAILADERRRRLFALVNELPDAQRSAIQLRFAAGLEYAELAECEGCPEATARTRVHLGLKKLRELLGKRGGP